MVTPFNQRKPIARTTTQVSALSKYNSRDKKPMLIEDQKRLKTFVNPNNSTRPSSKLDKIKIQRTFAAKKRTEIQSTRKVESGPKTPSINLE
jgi:hypothetical protein